MTIPHKQDVKSEDFPLFSVVIPTYNRPKELSRTLNVLLPQAQLLRVPVVILDNACPVGAKHVMESYPEFIDSVKIIRNRANIGGNANICRCFEICETEWMWLLGDDDIPEENCIKTMLEELKSIDPRVCYVNFSCNHFSHPKSMVIDGLDGLAARLNDRTMASNLLFISVGMFNVNACRKYLVAGYQHTYTCAPHLAILFSALGGGNQICKFSKNKIVQYMMPNAENQWSTLKLFAGITGLYELGQHHESMRSIMKVFLVHCRWNLFLPNGVVAIFCDSKYSPRQWLLMLSRAVILGNLWVRTQSVLMIMTLPLASIKFLRYGIGKFLIRFDKKITMASKRD